MALVEGVVVFGCGYHCRCCFALFGYCLNYEKTLADVQEPWLWNVEYLLLYDS